MERTITHRSTRDLRSGNRMPVLGVGTWRLEETENVIEQALTIGYRMIDTSGDYGTQPGIGEGIRKSGVDRSDIYIVTKVEETGDSYDAVRANLDELRLDYADLILIHRPPEQGVGRSLWEGLIRARDDGLARDIGVSNYDADRIEDLVETTNEVPVVNQIEWTPFGCSPAFLDYARRRDFLVQAYSPLTRSTRLDDGTLGEVAQTYRKSPAQILIRWNLQLGTVPLPKANQSPHLRENFDVYDFQLTEADMDRLSNLNRQYSALGTLPYV